MCPPGDLEQEDDLLDVGRTHRRRGTARVVVHRHAELFADAPERVVVVDVVQLRHAASGRGSGQQHTAAQTVLVRPAHLGDGGVDVVQHDLRDSGPAAARLPAEVGEPAVVRLQPGPAAGEVTRVRSGRLSGERDLREERRHRVREDDFGDDAVRFQVGKPAIGIPVAGAPVADQILVRDLVGGRPGVEILEPAALQIRPVAQHVRAGMAVG